MTFGPTLSAAASYTARYLAASCVITRPSGEPVFDPSDGTYTEPAPTTVYTGACQVLPVGRDRVVQFSEVATSLRLFDVTLDGLTATIHVGDRIAVSSSGDQRLNGLTLTVLDVPSSSLPTNRRLVAEEVL